MSTATLERDVKQFLAWADIHDRIEEILMSVVEVSEWPVKVGDAPAVYVSYETYQAIRESALGRMEQAMGEANAAYNEGTDTHEQILAILHALRDACNYADVVYTLTAMPEDDEADRELAVPA